MGNDEIPTVELKPYYDPVGYEARRAWAYRSIIEEQDRKAYEMLYGKEEIVKKKQSAVEQDEFQTEVLLERKKEKDISGLGRALDLRTDDDALARAELEHVSGIRLRLQFMGPVGREPGWKIETDDLQEALEELVRVVATEGFKFTLLEAVDGCVSVKVS